MKVLLSLCWLCRGSSHAHKLIGFSLSPPRTAKTISSSKLEILRSHSHFLPIKNEFSISKQTPPGWCKFFAGNIYFLSLVNNNTMTDGYLFVYNQTPIKFSSWSSMFLPCPRLGWTATPPCLFSAPCSVYLSLLASLEDSPLSVWNSLRVRWGHYISPTLYCAEESEFYNLNLRMFILNIDNVRSTVIFSKLY